MNPTPYELFQHIERKGYLPPMAGQVIIDSLTKPVSPDGKVSNKYTGTGEHLKMVMELDRLNVFKCFYDGGPDSFSSWICDEKHETGELMPLWRERLIHASVMHSQEKVDTTMDYLLHVLGQEKKTN